MWRLHRIHAGFILGGSLLRAFRRTVFTLLLSAGCIWLIDKSFNERPAALLTGCVIVFCLRNIIHIAGELLGPPEPDYDSGATRKIRKALRRRGMMRRW